MGLCQHGGKYKVIGTNGSGSSELKVSSVLVFFELETTPLHSIDKKKIKCFPC